MMKKKILFKEPIFKECANIRTYRPRQEVYAKGVERSVRLFSLKQEHNWSDAEFKLALKAINDEYSLALHNVMFVPALERLTTEQQKAKWLPLARNYQVVGTYAQTELGHGTYLQGLETTATYDATTEEFVLNTPKVTSIKWWPGSLGKSVNFAIIQATLIIDGKKYGMHPFLTQLRSLEDHKPLPGIGVGDIGPKLSMNHVDNGYLILNNVRIPRENMLMKNAQVSREGQFTSRGPSKGNYSAMILVRVEIVLWCFISLSNASTIAVRYSAIRRQSKLDSSQEESKILDYQTQQYKVFPCLATSYALFFISKTLRNRYTRIHAEMMKGNYKNLPEIHSQSAGMKALASEMTVEVMEVSRQACGGHGYLAASTLGDIVIGAKSLITVEGENTVLYLQVARYLMKRFAAAAGEEPLSGSTDYLNKDPNEYRCPLKSPRDCRNVGLLCEVYRFRAYVMIANAAKKLQRDIEAGKKQHVAMNDNLVQLVRAAKAHMMYCMIKDYNESMSQLQTSLPVANALHYLQVFFSVFNLIKNGGDFLETEAVGLSQMEWLKEVEVQMLAEIRPDAVSLVDAFDIHDDALGSVLGCYDGNVYERMLKSTENEPLNQSDVHYSYHQHLKPFLHKNNPSKL
ncbi:peroxisomal acyl-coenzyme A oxidase 1-like isoform X2 [Ostrea edulis]|uniref:peroxisomal acyl-coenzyme A oxidase 1-like isoform X2 n=1 Tax=Ostrea edulis TaxID=37623 RepID=UPI0024AF1878|nr:peroxisomal acyl-coenzyme A oxidase 1-like isoform X2 [Ostrea edulis]XP_048740598.2 peroxisomal acyl-coenzyme A oxidase 1-like isoform X2 [Ostrea edulis]